MKRTIAMTVVIAMSFYLGFAFKAIMAEETKASAPLKKVTSIGGIGLKSCGEKYAVFAA